MKVFISWSGDFSREVAEKLSEWIPGMIQSVDTFFSPDDIGKGENWNNVLSKELHDCNFGIVCLTPENVAAPWIHFEAGALAKSMDSRLSSIMLGISPSDIKGPLSRFQNTKFERTDFFKLVQAINNATDSPLGPNSLTIVFDAMWKKLEEEVQPIIQKYEVTPKHEDIQTNDHEALQEILRIVRKNSFSTRASLVYNPAFIRDESKTSSAAQLVQITISDVGQKPMAVLSVLSTLTHIQTKDLLDIMKKQNEFCITLPDSLSTDLLDVLSFSNASYSHSKIQGSAR